MPSIDETTRATINQFLAQYETLVIATEHEGQPFVTRAFYVEKPIEAGETSLTLYGTFIVTSRKLANLRENARVGLFIGPDMPSVWLEATARLRGRRRTGQRGGERQTGSKIAHGGGFYRARAHRSGGNSRGLAAHYQPDRRPYLYRGHL